MERITAESTEDSERGHRNILACRPEGMIVTEILYTILIACAFTSSASAQAVKATIKRGGEIVAQPARDVGAAKTKIPPVLKAAHEDPYGLAGLAQCWQLQQAINELNDVLGPDYAVGNEKKALLQFRLSGTEGFRTPRAEASTT
jgi:hypothetical protein